MQPQLRVNNDCVIMLMNILAEPDWINIPCDQKLFAFVICQNMLHKRKMNDKGNVLSLSQKEIHTCPYAQLFITNRCISFKKHSSLSQLKNYNRYGNYLENILVKKAMAKTLKEYFTIIQHFYIQPIQFTIAIPSNNTYLLFEPLHTAYYLKLSWRITISNYLISKYQGYMLFAEKPSIMEIPSNVYKCKDGTYIDEKLICDGQRDCVDETDEKQCHCNHGKNLFDPSCKYFCNEIFQHCICSDFYFSCLSSVTCIPYSKVCDGHKDCILGEDEICEINLAKEEKVLNPARGSVLYSQTFTCLESNTTISIALVDDLIPDCPNTFEDEMQYYSLMTNPFHSYIPCNNTRELPCIPGHSHCFQLDHLCIFDIQPDTGTLRHCRNGAHLYNCTSFQCPEYFKCSMTYCIPFDLICNGKWDCPQGHDEVNCNLFSCPNLFKCKNQTKCLHFSKVCDSNKDCILGDDESWCTQDSVLVCPKKCKCFAQSIICNNVSENSHHQRSIWISIKYFQCIGCNLAGSTRLLFSLQFIIILNVREYLFESICINKYSNIPILSSLNLLDISSNTLTRTESLCLVSLNSLTIYYLQHNSISYLEEKSFYLLLNLKILDLSHNKITKLQNTIFNDLISIKVINLTFNQIMYVSSDTFKEVSPNTVYSYNVRVCCLSNSWIKCKVIEDAFSNCDNLLSNRLMNYFCWLVGFLIVSLNTVSLLINRISANLQNNTLLTIYLSLVDWCFGAYLLVIASADLYYKDYYVGYELAWKNNLVCKASAFLALSSMMTSPIILVIIMIARYCVVQWPMTSQFRNKSFVKSVVQISFITSLCLCMLLIAGLFGIYGKPVPTGICLPLYISKDQSILILLTSLIIISVQMCSLLLISVLTILIIIKLINTEKNRPSQINTIKSKKVSVDLLLVIIKNIWCWLPSSIVFILPLVGYQVSSHLLVVITVCVIPINTGLDPLLFTVFNPEMRRSFVKVFNLST